MTVPRTTSGKIQRSRTRDELRASRLAPLSSDLTTAQAAERATARPACPAEQ